MGETKRDADRVERKEESEICSKTGRKCVFILLHVHYNLHTNGKSKRELRSFSCLTTFGKAMVFYCINIANEMHIVLNM